MRKLIITAISTLFFASGIAAEPGATAKSKATPFTLKTCPVSDEKLGGEMGEPYVFEQEGRQIKLCCKSCLKDFKKNPAKYVKKIEAAERESSAKK